MIYRHEESLVRIVTQIAAQKREVWCGTGCRPAGQSGMRICMGCWVKLLSLLYCNDTRTINLEYQGSGPVHIVSKMKYLPMCNDDGSWLDGL